MDPAAIATGSAEKLTAYGPLGIFCVLAFLFIAYLVRRGEKQEERHSLELKALNEQHRAELKVEREKLEGLYKTYVADAREWTDGYDDIAAKISSAVESMLRAKRGG